MQLTKIGYEEYVGAPREWKLTPFDLQHTNLIVGRNSVGKTRTLNIISSLSRVITAGEAAMDGSFYAEFSHNDDLWSYTLHVGENAVLEERLVRNSDVLLDRKEEEIWSDEYGRTTKFRVLPHQVAVKAKFDLIQTPFLEPINTWANSVVFLHFNAQIGQNSVLMPMAGVSFDVNLKDENQTGYIFKHCLATYGESFRDAIVSDMHTIGYDINNVSIGDLSSLKAIPMPATSLQGMIISENGINCGIEQHFISTGMFRALAIIVHINVGVFSKENRLILVDDIGEGLDYERSTKLIKLLVSKIDSASAQIIFTSNDRFIMNAVDIDFWTVLSRAGSCVSAHNKTSHPKAFEEFGFTGLQNFDFFALNFATEEV